MVQSLDSRQSVLDPSLERMCASAALLSGRVKRAQRSTKNDKIILFAANKSQRIQRPI